MVLKAVAFSSQKILMSKIDFYIKNLKKIISKSQEKLYRLGEVREKVLPPVLNL